MRVQLEAEFGQQAENNSSRMLMVKEFDRLGFVLFCFFFSRLEDNFFFLSTFSSFGFSTRTFFLSVVPGGSELFRRPHPMYFTQQPGAVSPVSGSCPADQRVLAARAGQEQRGGDGSGMLPLPPPPVQTQQGHITFAKKRQKKGMRVPLLTF